MKGRASLLIMCALLVAGGSSAATEMVPMRDGIHLATDVFLPDGDGPWPAILLRSPYGRLALGDLTRMGYVVVSQDMRGYGGSEGLRTPFETDGWGELQDGYDTLEWISAQPWSDGRVGTWGGSALGITQNLLAGSHPEGLSCQFILAGASTPRIFLPKLMKWYRQGRFPVDRLTKTFPFEDINTAFAESQAGRVVKPVLLMA